MPILQLLYDLPLFAAVVRPALASAAPAAALTVPRVLCDCLPRAAHRQAHRQAPERPVLQGGRQPAAGLPPLSRGRGAAEARGRRRRGQHVPRVAWPRVRCISQVPLPLLAARSDRGARRREYAAAGITQLRLPTPDLSMPRLEDVATALDFISHHVERGKVFVHCRVRARLRSPLQCQWAAGTSRRRAPPSLAWAAVPASCWRSSRGTAPCPRRRASTLCALAARRYCTASASRQWCAASRTEAVRWTLRPAPLLRLRAAARAIWPRRPRASCVGPGADAAECQRRRPAGAADPHLQRRPPPRAALYRPLGVLSHALGVLVGVLSLVQQPGRGGRAWVARPGDRVVPKPQRAGPAHLRRTPALPLESARCRTRLKACEGAGSGGGCGSWAPRAGEQAECAHSAPQSRTTARTGYQRSPGPSLGWAPPA